MDERRDGGVEEKRCAPTRCGRTIGLRVGDLMVLVDNFVEIGKIS
jgi:hypothetical protein